MPDKQETSTAPALDQCNMCTIQLTPVEYRRRQLPEQGRVRVDFVFVGLAGNVG